MMQRAIVVRSTRVIVLSIALLASVMAGQAIGHIWNHSNLHYWESGSSNYGSRSHLRSDSKYDYHGLNVQAKRNGSVIQNKSASCGPVNEACGTNSYSPAIYFSQTSTQVYIQNCATDDGHQLHPYNYGGTGGVCHGKNVDYDEVWLS